MKDGWTNQKVYRLYQAVEDAKIQHLYGNKNHHILLYSNNYGRVVALFFVRRHSVVCTWLSILFIRRLLFGACESNS